MQRGTGSLEESGSHRRLIETSAVRLPSVGLEGSDGSRVRLAVWGAALEGCVRAMIVEVGREIDELGLEVRGRPKEGTIQEFSSDGAVLWRSPLCGAKPGAPRQTLVPLRLSTT